MDKGKDFLGDDLAGLFMDSPVNRPLSTATEQLFSLIRAELVEFHGSQMGV